MNDVFFAGEEICRLLTEGTLSGAPRLVSSLDEAQALASKQGSFFVFPSHFSGDPAQGAGRVSVEEQVWTVAVNIDAGGEVPGELLYSITSVVSGRPFRAGCDVFRRVPPPVPVFDGVFSFYMQSFSVKFPVVIGK